MLKETEKTFSKNQKEQIVELYSGFNILEAVGGALILAGGGFGTFKALKQIPAGYEGIRITLGKAHGKSLKEGPALTDPLRRIQRIVLVDMTPQEIDLPARMKCLTKDGVEVTTNVTAILKVGSSKDLVRIVHPKPVIRLEQEPGIKSIVATLTDTLSRQVISKITREEITQEAALKRLREANQSLLQTTLDKIFLDKLGQKEVEEKMSQGISRKEIERGIIVLQVAFTVFELSPEVVEAMQEEVGAPMRARAEEILSDALGPNYPVARTSQAAEQVARTAGATIVFGVNPTEGAILGKMKERPTSVQGARNKIDEIRKKIDRTQGEGR